MAELNPLFLSGSRIRQMTSSLNTVVDYIHFSASIVLPTAGSSPIATTNLPDPYLFASLSANITSNNNAINTNLYQYNIPNRQEDYFYTSNAIIGVSTSLVTTGVRIGLLRSQLANTAFALKSPSSLTAFTFANVTTQAITTYVLPNSHAAINTIYPTHFKGFTSNILTNSESSISNTYVVQPETVNIVSASVGSVFYNQFAGYTTSTFETDTSFNIGTGFNDIVYSIYPQSDGKILVGGSFTSYLGSTQNFITRINSDGTRDTSFNIGTGFNVEVRSILEQPDGKILVGGTFSSYSGSTQNRLVRLNTNGTIDTSFNIGTGFNDSVFVVYPQSDGKILVGGQFTTYSGSTQNRITRLNSDGTRDTSFNIGTGISRATFTPTVNTLYQQLDGKILAGGFFDSYSGSTQNYITRINSNGTLDTSFNTGTGLNNTILSIVQQPDDKILIGGGFATYSGSAQNNITRTNLNGTRDTSFNIGTGLSSFPRKIYLQPDGKILVGGTFSSYSGSTQNRITRLNSDGTRDTSFNIGTGFNDVVFSITQQSDGKILVGGTFTSFSGISSNRIIRLLSTPIPNTPKSPLYFNSGSLSTVSGSDTITSSFLPPTSSLWLSQSLATSIGVNSTTNYTNVFTLTGLTTGQRYLVNLYMIGLSDSVSNGFRMRVVTGSQYMGTLWTPTTTAAPAIQNSSNGDNITSIIANDWPTTSGKYLVYGEYTFVKGATDPQVQIISRTGATTTAISGSVIFYRPII
jgi:uncharacterized delta-60 repeat protein